MEDRDDIYTFFSFSDIDERRTSKGVYSPENTLKVMSFKARWWWCTPLIPTRSRQWQRQRQADLCEFEASLVYSS